MASYAPCPSCSKGEAQAVGFTWWAGALGPRMFSHVRCLGCGTNYNGKTGKSNSTAIGIYLGVSVLAIVGIYFAVG